jgi:2-dehydropantoate 2-reductase
MDIAVYGITPVGCTVAALLSGAGHVVTIIGPDDKARRIRDGGITVRQVWDGTTTTASVKAEASLGHKPELIIFATRMQDVHDAALDAAGWVDGADIATIQYGTKPEQVVSRTLPRDAIVTCVLTLGATCYSPGDVTLNFKGHMVVGKAYDAPEPRVDRVLAVMGGAFTVHKGFKIAHYNCTRLLLNLPYCIPAIIGVKVQKAFSDPDIAAVAVMLLKEGIGVIEEAEVHIEPLPDFNESSLKSLLAAPLPEAAVRFGDITTNMSRIPCQGPVLGSIEQGEPTEIDFINGELVKIAGVLERPTPLNSLMVTLVHEVERTRKFMSKAEFLAAVKAAS